MDAWARIAREFRFIDNMVRTLITVRNVKPDSENLICDTFEEAVDKFANHTALIFEDERYTYAQLDALANRIAAWTEAQGLKAGDTVAVLLPNRSEYVPAWIGLTKRGVAAALINSNLTGAALAHCLSISGASHVITDVESLAAVDTIRVGMARPLTYWVIDAKSDLAADRKQLDLKTPKLPPERPPRSVRAGLKARETALFIYTSGTTGMPKAAKITHARAQLYMLAFVGASRAGPEDRLYNALPLYHSTGGLCGVGVALLTGATLVLRRKFSATHFWDDVVTQGCTIFVYIGELCRYLVNQPVSDLERAHKLRLAFGNGLRPDVWKEFEERFHVPRILEFYGSTEGNVSLFNFDSQVGAVGRVPPYLKSLAPKLVKFDVDEEVPVRGPDGLCIEAPVGEVGEAIGEIKDDARHNYSGYADKAASDRKILTDVFVHGDKWFRTGDLMRTDEDGYFYFVDRIGDTFRWKGENVSTTEVAEAIAKYPGADEVNVYGVKIDKLDGRAGMAAITPGPAFKLEGLPDFIAHELPSYARPIFVRIQPRIETTGTFKYRKVDLVRDGFDPAKTEQKLYFLAPGAHAYELITPELYGRIQGGGYKL